MNNKKMKNNKNPKQWEPTNGKKTIEKTMN